MATEACPSVACTRWIGAPRSSACVAWLWRSQCGETLPATPGALRGLPHHPLDRSRVQVATAVSGVAARGRVVLARPHTAGTPAAECAACFGPPVLGRGLH